MGLSDLNAVYAKIARAAEGGDFVDVALRELGVEYAATDADRARIPSKGPLIVVANHPFGAVEGLILLDLVRRARPDARALANRLLARIPELRPLIFDVDVFGGEGAAASNRVALRRAIRWLRGGGALLAFPAGEVSHARPFQGAVDPPWNAGISDVVDGLVIVDLLESDTRTLARYLGRDGVRRLRAYHGAKAAVYARPTPIA